MDSVPEDIAMVEVTEDDAKYRTKKLMEVGIPMWRPLTGEAGVGEDC